MQQAAATADRGWQFFSERRSGEVHLAGGAMGGSSRRGAARDYFSSSVHYWGRLSPFLIPRTSTLHLRRLFKNCCRMLWPRGKSARGKLRGRGGTDPRWKVPGKKQSMPSMQVRCPIFLEAAAPTALLKGGRCRLQRPWGSSSLPPYQKLPRPCTSAMVGPQGIRVQRQSPPVPGHAGVWSCAGTNREE